MKQKGGANGSSLFTNIIIYVSYAMLYLYWFTEEYQYVISWIILFWTAISGPFLLYKIFNTEQIKNKFLDSITQFELNTSARVFPVLLFTTAVVTVLSKIISLILILVSLTRGTSKHKVKLSYQHQATFSNYKIVYILLSALVMFSYAMLYFGTLADKYTTSKMENVVKNLIFYLLPTVIMIYMIYLLFHASVSLYTVSSNSLFAIPKEKPIMMTVDLDAKRKADEEAERLRLEAEERRRKQKEEEERLRREEEERQREEAERIRNAENEAKCGVCY